MATQCSFNNMKYCLLHEIYTTVYIFIYIHGILYFISSIYFTYYILYYLIQYYSIFQLHVLRQNVLIGNKFFRSSTYLNCGRSVIAPTLGPSIFRTAQLEFMVKIAWQRWTCSIPQVTCQIAVASNLTKPPVRSATMVLSRVQDQSHNWSSVVRP